MGAKKETQRQREHWTRSHRQEEDAQTVPTHESQHSGASPLARAPPGAYDRLSQPPQTVGLHGPQLPTKALGIPPNPAHSETISLPTAPLTVAEAPDYLEAVFHLSTGNQAEPGSLCLFCRAVPKATSGSFSLAWSPSPSRGFPQWLP